MNILVAGASGFIGRELIGALEKSHNVTVLGRDLNRLKQKFSLSVSKITWETLPQLDAGSFDVIINLSGSNIGQKRWNNKIKEELVSSRVLSNKKIIDWLNKTNAKPRYICANAVGIYGLQDSDDLTAFDEDTPVEFIEPKDFLNEIGVAWQQSLSPAINAGISTVTLRFGVVLMKNKGMLKKLELPFYLGLGSVIGDGKQVISWVHIEDVIGVILFVLDNPDIQGAINVVSPGAVSQREFANTLAATMRRPLIFKMPKTIIHLLFGEMGECLLLKGQRVLPKRLDFLGYEFKHQTISAALEREYHNNEKSRG